MIEKQVRAVSNKIKTKNFFLCFLRSWQAFLNSLTQKNTGYSFSSILPCPSRVKAVAWYAGGVRGPQAWQSHVGSIYSQPATPPPPHPLPSRTMSPEERRLESNPISPSPICSVVRAKFACVDESKHCTVPTRPATTVKLVGEGLKLPSSHYTTIHVT